MNGWLKVKRGFQAALVAAVLAMLSACVSAMTLNNTVDQFNSLRDRYLLKVLELNPVSSMYFVGAGFGQSFRGINGRLRDYRPEAISEEVAFFREMQRARNAIRPEYLPPQDRTDHAILGAQINFILYQLEAVRYYERCVDTYVEEPYRGIQWQIQQMERGGEGLRGSEEEWGLVYQRVVAIPSYLDAARANLLSGKASGNLPPLRAVERYGIQGSRNNAEYFRNTLPRLAREYIGERPFGERFLSEFESASIAAGTAYSSFASFIDQTYRDDDAQDMFVIVEPPDGLKASGLEAAAARSALGLADLVVRGEYQLGLVVE